MNAKHRLGSTELGRGWADCGACGCARQRRGSLANWHSGVTLVEMLLAILLTAIVAAVTAEMVFQMKRAHDHDQESLSELTALDRLAERFRSDAAAAHDARPIAATQELLDAEAFGRHLGLVQTLRAGLELIGPRDQRVEYGSHEELIERNAFEGERRVAHDVFRLGGWDSIDIARSSTPGLVCCRLERTPAAEQDVKNSSRSLVIEARLGRPITPVQPMDAGKEDRAVP